MRMASEPLLRASGIVFGVNIRAADGRKAVPALYHPAITVLPT
jgi:hypothetical protein